MGNDINTSKPGSQRGQDKLSLSPVTRDMVLLQLEWKRSRQVYLVLRGIFSLDLKREWDIIYP